MKLISIFLLSSLAFGRVAFLETRDSNGKLQQFEEDFTYTHVAIEVENRWLHAYPKRGVELITLEELQKIGTVAEYLEVPAGAFTLGEEKRFLGKPYDAQFSWGDEAIYCSELVGKILGIEPVPMHFPLKFWPPSYQEWEGDPGVSPGVVYRWLQ